MMAASWQTIKSRWMTVLAEMMAEHSLPEIPAYAVQLPPPGKTSVEPEVAKSRVAELAKSINQPKDYKAWAKKLVAQEENGPGRPHPKALEIAREALANG